MRLQTKERIDTLANFTTPLTFFASKQTLIVKVFFFLHDSIFQTPKDLLEAARALAILGAIFLVFASVVAVVDVVFKSQGDRRRLVPICIISLCAAAGKLKAFVLKR